ncbi:hypothetical protein [Pseudonocardia sp. H11422]|uniref:hypothetical protein n=1 Tax=Pseudonocardia sp. H11422 TaxID=2835866 RepID=UPI001BDC9D14|nr:hypothetical protein [Pseudonocardia sp. H11422]
MPTFLPFLHAATRARKPLMWVWVVLCTAAVVTLFAATGNANVGGYIIGLMITACVHLVVVRRQVWPRSVTVAPPPPPGLNARDPAVAAALAARSPSGRIAPVGGRRPAAGPRAAHRPPDLPHSYDDGGLVDLSSAPPQVIAGVCGIDLTLAARITEARTTDVPFSTVDEVFSSSTFRSPSGTASATGQW